MIGVTNAAREKMKALIAANGAAEAGIRIAVGGKGCDLAYRFAVVAAPFEGDVNIAEGGVRVYFSPSDFRHLLNVEIDHDGSPDEQGFTVKKAACG